MSSPGFTGRIEPRTRRHYLQRLDRLIGDRADAGEKTNMIIRLFACVLLHRQFDMFSAGPGCNPVKFSFLKAAGGPDFITAGRVDIRSIKASVTKRSLAPWSAKGYLRIRQGRVVPAMKTWREAMHSGSDLVPARILLNRGPLSVDVKADLLLDGQLLPPDG